MRLELDLLGCLCCAAALAAQPGPVVADGFEGGSLGRDWETSKCLPGAVRLQSELVRAGHGAARITLRPGDQIPGEEGSGRERAELQEARRWWSAEDASWEYAFSVFIPGDFPIVPTRLVIAQWKQRCPGGGCAPDNPVLAIRYAAGELRITRQAGKARVILYRTREDLRDRWLDFRFRTRFARGASGVIQGWLGGNRVVDYRGPTAYAGTDGYPAPGLFYFKIGLYRDRMALPMTLYVDEYRKAPWSGELP